MAPRRRNSSDRGDIGHQIFIQVERNTANRVGAERILVHSKHQIKHKGEKITIEYINSNRVLGDLHNELNRGGEFGVVRQH